MKNHVSRQSRDERRVSRLHQCLNDGAKSTPLLALVASIARNIVNVAAAAGGRGGGGAAVAAAIQR